MKKEKFNIPDYYDFRKPEFINKKKKVERDCMKFLCMVCIVEVI